MKPFYIEVRALLLHGQTMTVFPVRYALWRLNEEHTGPSESSSPTWAHQSSGRHPIGRVRGITSRWVRAGQNGPK